MTETRRPGAPYFAGAPLLIAHRGGAALAPENTLAAFRSAIDDWRADMLELDVRVTRDGEAIVFHDDTLERTTDGAGRVADHLLAAIRELDAGYGFQADDGSFPFRGKGVHVSTLAEVIDACPEARINIEVKEIAAAPAVARAVRETGSAHRVLIAAGNRACRVGLESLGTPISASEPELRAFYLHSLFRLSRFHHPRIDALQLPDTHGGRRIVSPRLIQDAHRKNIAVHVWTVDDEDDMRRLLDWGVDGVMTDRPDRLARVMGRA